jgi:hypothetical protein
MIKRVLLLVVLLYAINVKAVNECDKSEMRRLKEEASHLTFTYEFKEQSSSNGNITGTFDIVVDNIPTDLRPLVIHSWDLRVYDEFVPNSNGTGRLTGFFSGQKVKINVKAYVDNGCITEDVLIKTIQLPYINKFFGSKECKESPNFKLCRDKLTNINVSEETFKSEYKKYLKEQELANPELVVNNSKIYIALALIILIPLAFVIKNVVINIIEKRKDEI